MASDPSRMGEMTMDAASLYREEIYTDRKAGTLRVLQPVKSDGSAGHAAQDRVPGRSPADDEHGTVADQLRHRRRDARRRGRRLRRRDESGRRARDARNAGDAARQASSSIVLPPAGATLGPGGGLARGGKIQLP